MTPDSDRDLQKNDQKVQTASKLQQLNKKAHMNGQQPNANMLYQDGGTGASLKRVFIYQDSGQTSQGDTQSQGNIKAN